MATIANIIFLSKEKKEKLHIQSQPIIDTFCWHRTTKWINTMGTNGNFYNKFLQGKWTPVQTWHLLQVLAGHDKWPHTYRMLQGAEFIQNASQGPDVTRSTKRQQSKNYVMHYHGGTCIFSYFITINLFFICMSTHMGHRVHVEVRRQLVGILFFHHVCPGD